MSIKRYDPAVKTAFSKAAHEARQAGKSWVEAHAAAKEAGYKGSAGGLQQLLYIKPAKRLAKKHGMKAGRPKGTRKRGSAQNGKATPASLEQKILAFVDERVEKKFNELLELLTQEMRSRTEAVRRASV